MALRITLIASILVCLASAFTPNVVSNARPVHPRLSTILAETSSSSSSCTNDNPHSLPPELLKIATAFATIGDDKLRYKQLLYMANAAPAITDPTTLCQPANQVPGCLSTVYITATTTQDKTAGLHFTGDSDGLLTKGLVALLLRGCAGCTAAQVEAIDPQFIQTTGIAASLTPGRNNGFLNMLAVMKRKAWEATEDAAAAATESGKEEKVDAVGESSIAEEDDATSAVDGGPIYRTMVATLQTALEPTSLELKDVSYQHAGHAEAGDGTGESHFDVSIVSEAFGGLNLVKRHQLVYRSLADVMPKIHALQIQAKTPEEVA